MNTELRDEVEDRKRAEQALRVSEEKLASLLESERVARGDAEHCQSYQGRVPAGSPEAQIFMASPATVAASAITGYITDPRSVTP